MGRVIAIANQKGGVGKTTTSISLAAGLARLGQSVLLADLDPQGNATTGSGVAKQAIGHSSLEILLGTASITDAVLQGLPGGYDLLPSNGALTAAEVTLLGEDGGQLRLRQALQAVRGRYEQIILDCPPSLSMLTVNALVAADGILVPIQCEYYALEGLSALLETIERIRSTLNPALCIDGFLRTMFDGRNYLARDVSAQLEAHFGDQVLATLIPRNVRLAEAPSHGLPIFQYDPLSRGALAHAALAREVLQRQGMDLPEQEMA